MLSMTVYRVDDEGDVFEEYRDYYESVSEIETLIEDWVQFEDYDGDDVQVISYPAGEMVSFQEVEDLLADLKLTEQEWLDELGDDDEADWLADEEDWDELEELDD